MNDLVLKIERHVVAGILILIVYPLTLIFDRLLEPVLYGIGRTIFDFRICIPGWVRQNKGKAARYCLVGPFRYWHRRVFGFDFGVTSVCCGKSTFVTPAEVARRFLDVMQDRLERRYGRKETEHDSDM